MSPEYVLPMSSEDSVTYVPGWFGIQRPGSPLISEHSIVFKCELNEHIRHSEFRGLPLDFLLG